ncbi:MAG: hypothetical protein KDC54_13505 [Lewinella sp.]|nr:hypothetical protein [Lewinella sp.]
MSKDHTNHVSCPKCSWQPDGQAHWKCKCGHTWDMFSTGGRCPACLRQWEKTRCPPKAGGCNSWSPHLEWYGDLQGWLIEELRYLPEITTQRKDQ